MATDRTRHEIAPTIDEIRALLNEEDELCVSIFLPTHRVSAKTDADRIRLKNLVKEADTKLASRDVRPPDRDRILAPARDMLRDTIFFEHLSDGLALFLRPGSFHFARVPRSLEELVVVSDHFQIKPLLPLLASDGRFLVLALSQNRVRLVEASRDGAREIDLGDVPASLAEAGIGPGEPSLQFHTKAPPGGREKSAVHFGHGVAGDDASHKKRIEEFLRRVARPIEDRVRKRRQPIVLAGVDYIVDLFRKVASYPRILEGSISTNADELSTEDLGRRGFEVAQEHLREAIERDLERLRELGPKAVTDLGSILVAAAEGRVEVAFLPERGQEWGTFDREARRVQRHGERRRGDRDLLDLVATETLARGGQVHTVERDELPNGTTVAAILRF